MDFDSIFGKGKELWEGLLQSWGALDDSGPQCTVGENHRA